MMIHLQPAIQPCLRQAQEAGGEFGVFTEPVLRVFVVNQGGILCLNTISRL